jgi:very-short-patch-repair endonuclease
VLRRLLDLRDPKARPAQSVLEVKFLRRIRGRGLPAPVRQLQVKTDTGRRFLDFAWPHAGLDVEVGGRRSHSGPAAEQRDSKRHNELTSLGWRVLYFTWDDIEHRIDYVVRCIERELRPQLM